MPLHFNRLKPFFCLPLFCAALFAQAQKKQPAMPAMPDVSKLMKMSPSELEAYKQKMIKQAGEQGAALAREHNLPVDRSEFVGAELKPPVKDLKRLQLLPVQPPTRMELVSSLQQSVAQIKKGLTAPTIQKVEQFVSTQPVEIVNGRAVMDFYGNDPEGAILMLTKLAAKAPDSLLYLNNLGAVFNMIGVEHKAVPILQYCLQKLPASATVMNNLGQSFYGLGDLLKAANFFRQCLAIDSLNVEANHTMGMMHYFKKEFPQAKRCFERELSKCVRKSTMAMAERMGTKFDHRALMKKRNQRAGRPQKDFLEEITLGKFSMPRLPATAEEQMARKAEIRIYTESVQAESTFWLQRMNEVGQVQEDPTSNYAGPYFYLVRALLEDWNKEFDTEYMSPFPGNDDKELIALGDEWGKKMNAVKYPPTPYGLGIAAEEAWRAKQCQQLKRPVADGWMQVWSAFYEARWGRTEKRWKAKINELIDIVQLDPSPGNLALVYGNVSGYFTFLGMGAGPFGTDNISDYLADCETKYTLVQLDSLIKADRAWNVNCPPWLNVEVATEWVTFKADCNKYVFEGSGSGIAAAFEHEFKSGNSTVLFGPGQKFEFRGVSLGETKTQFMLTFDSHGRFSDFGVKSTTELGVGVQPFGKQDFIKVGGTLAGVEMSNSWTIEGGSKTDVEWKGAMVPVVEYLYGK